MNREWWVLYLACYLAFSAWAILQLPEPHTFNLTDILYLLMMTGIVGLALNKRIISLSLWRVMFWIGITLLIHAWVIMPIIYLNEGLQLLNIGIIQLFSVPALPLFIGLYIYAYRSPEIWLSSAQQGAQAGPPPSSAAS